MRGRGATCCARGRTTAIGFFTPTSLTLLTQAPYSIGFCLSQRNNTQIGNETRLFTNQIPLCPFIPHPGISARPLENKKSKICQYTNPTPPLTPLFPRGSGSRYRPSPSTLHPPLCATVTTWGPQKQVTGISHQEYPFHLFFSETRRKRAEKCHALPYRKGVE